MKNIANNNYNQPNQVNINPNENKILSNSEKNNEQNGNNIQNKEDDMDDSDNLKYKDFMPQNSVPLFNQRLDSSDSPIAAQYKFSIDMPNVSKQRLHEYLNNDLLNALDVSPSISKLNSGLNNNKPQNEINIDNNPNNLYGFSLYPQANNPNNMNQNYNFQNPINNNNYNFSKDINYNYSNGNLNYYQNYNNKFPNLAYNMNVKEFIPTKMRMNEQNNAKDIQINPKNKFSSGNKKNKQKGKKYFEVRDGDWRCNQCNNLNFSFRNKCNRCNLPKELSQSLESMNHEMFNQNQQVQMINGMNQNFVQK